MDKIALTPHLQPAVASRQSDSGKVYTEVLAPSRAGVAISLLSPREVSTDIWTQVLQNITWKNSSR